MVLETCWDRFGFVFESFWDHVGGIWDPFSNYFKVVLAPFGIGLESLRNRLGVGMGSETYQKLRLQTDFKLPLFSPEGSYCVAEFAFSSSS